MFFKVTGEKNNINLDRFQLLDILIGEVLKADKEDHAAMANSLTAYLQEKTMLSQFNLDQLTVTAFTLGYYYRIFLEKNEVEIKNADKGETDESMASESTTEPTS